MDVRERLFEIREPVNERRGREPVFAQLPHELKVGRRDGAGVRAGRVREELEPALGADGGVALLNCSRRKIARIRVRLELPAGGARSFVLHIVNAREIVVRHIDFAAHFEPVGRAFGERERHVANRAHVRGNIFAKGPVAARERANELAVFVMEGRGDSVDLELADPREGLVGLLLRGGDELAQFPFVIDVLNREHGNVVADDFRFSFELLSDALGRARGEHKFGELLLQAFELLNEIVVLVVGDVRRVLDEIEPVAASNFFAEFFNFLLRFVARHGGTFVC